MTNAPDEPNRGKNRRGSAAPETAPGGAAQPRLRFCVPRRARREAGTTATTVGKLQPYSHPVAIYGCSPICNLACMDGIGKRINALRLLMGKSLQQYARMIGVSRQALLKWETGDTENIKIRNLLRISECHGISIDELVRGKAAKNARTSTPTEDFWPFSVNRKAFFRLPKRRKEAIDDYIRMVVNDCAGARK
jgi:transcriptional regulator with XRE-family HTH domain